MTVLGTTGSDTPENKETKEPIRFPEGHNDRRNEHLKRRETVAGSAIEAEFPLHRLKNPADQGVPAPAKLRPARAIEKKVEIEKKVDKELEDLVEPRRKRGISWTALSFLVMVLIPAAATTYYYMLMASPQYQVETQFSVRGSNESSMTAFGLSGLFGSSVQSGDSYIVASYLESLQFIRDVKSELGVDLRQYYSRDHIDMLYRIAPDMPLEKFTEYWRDMLEVSFNSTTGNMTVFVYAFTPDDTKAIADAVLKVSERLVNELSENSRQQMMLVASKQVDRGEERLRKVREELRKLRIDEKVLDPVEFMKTRAQLTSGIEKEISTLKTKLSVLLQSVDMNAPSAKVISRQIKALEAELAMQEGKLGDKDNSRVNNSTAVKEGIDSGNLAEAVNKFEELTVEQGFATQAYTTALAAFETSLAEAQKQERYFAVFVSPTRPEIALYPMRLLDSFIAFLVFGAFWMISQFLFRSFRDHAV